jgi:hypothetical protein
MNQPVAVRANRLQVLAPVSTRMRSEFAAMDLKKVGATAAGCDPCRFRAVKLTVKRIEQILQVELVLGAASTPF